MSIDKSLKSKKFSGQRNVRKRYERARSLMLQNKFDRIYGLPKEKIKKFKPKKEKKEEETVLSPFDVSKKEELKKTGEKK